MNRRLILWTFAFSLLSFSTGEAGEDDRLKQVRSRWEKLYQSRAESLSVSFAESDQRNLRMHAQPVLAYTNPVRNVQGHGSVFLWTESGRPVLAAAFWSVVERDDPSLRRLSREWHSLTEDTLVVESEAERLWTSTEPGIEWMRLDKVDGPLRSRSLRLTQMRRIARRLHAEIGTAEGELRLMPQPIYRYPEASGVLDGGVFAFVLGTDPELLAVIEARDSADAAAGWFVGFAHFTNAEVNATFDGLDIFQAERWHPIKSAGRHHLGIAVEHHPANLPD